MVTTGGTGPARRDVTPEATEAVCDKMLDGFGELMRAVSLKVVPTAILSRQIAGIRGRSLIVNLPGKPSAIRDCLLAVFPAIPYCIDLIEGPYLTTHEAVVKAFRPKSSRQRAVRYSRRQELRRAAGNNPPLTKGGQGGLGKHARASIPINPPGPPFVRGGNDYPPLAILEESSQCDLFF